VHGVLTGSAKGVSNPSAPGTGALLYRGFSRPQIPLPPPCDCAIVGAMNRVDRLMAMVVRLQSRRVVKAEDLAEHFEISVRTVYRDMGALGEAGIPIMAEAGVGYSLMKGYLLPPVMFSAEEASAMSVGGKLVEHLTDASMRKQMESALLKIRSVLPRDRQDYIDRLERSTAVMPGRTDVRPRLASEMLTPIQRALAERRVLALDYQGIKRREATRRQVEPLGLVYYADNWHLIAWCRLRREVRDFRTDRILNLQLLSEIFAGHANFSLTRYLENEWRNEEFKLIQIRFSPESMERVRQEWSCSLVEEVVEPEGITATLTVPTYQRIVGWVLSFGASAEVIEPEELKELVAAEAGQIVAKYTVTRKALPATQRTVAMSVRM
jgi:predicted DNA-binding transcriptional regulator YafY